MDTLDLLAALDLPPSSGGVGADGSDGFVDCRGVLHTWDEEGD
jgi:hypothetical protein